MSIRFPIRVLAACIVILSSSGCEQAIEQARAEAPAPASDPAPNAIDAGECPDTALAFRDGAVYRCKCPQNFASGPVYGGPVYSNDSSICTAGQHAGIANPTSGGTL